MGPNIFEWEIGRPFTIDYSSPDGVHLCHFIGTDGLFLILYDDLYKIFIWNFEYNRWMRKE